jgi:hypothetical protein
MAIMTEKVTFQESTVSDDKQPARQRSLRDHLGPLGFALTVVTVVLAFLALGAAVSVLVRETRRPPIVTPAHGALSRSVLASTMMERARWTRWGTHAGND